MFKNGFFYVIVIVFALSGLGCSSSSDSGEDLDISEIQEIEATGEFSEDEFFSNEGTSDLVEEELVAEVPGLEDELGDELAKLDAESDDSFDLEESKDTDLFDDLELDGIEGDVSSEVSENLSVDVDDVALELDDSSLDVDVDFDGEVSSGELSLDSEDDLFKDAEISLDDSNGEDVAAAQPQSSNSEEVTIDDVDYSEQIARVNNLGAASLAGEVTIDDIDYSAEVSKAALQASRGLIPVRKMKTVPYSRNGVLVNAVYFVRSGDTLRGIADKVYGTGSGVDFRIVNPHLKSGGLRVGQKVYYNSPVRSQDRSRLLTFYEDVRMPAQMYSAKSGDNIRAVSKELLGHSRSWMEIWASNQQIQSKGLLDQAAQIRYWNGRVTPSPTLARVEPSVTPPPSPTAVNNQAELDLGDEVASNQDAVDLNEPDMSSNEPANSDANDDFAMEEEEIFEETNEDTLAGNEEVFQEETQAFQEEEQVAASAEVREIARNEGGGFATKVSGGLSSETTKLGILGIAVLLLLIVGFIVLKRRRESNNATEIDSFDFGGETSVDEFQTKTQIDI